MDDIWQRVLRILQSAWGQGAHVESDPLSWFDFDLGGEG